MASRIFKNHSLWRTETKQSGCTSNYNLEWVYKLLPYYKVMAEVKHTSQRSAGLAPALYTSHPLTLLLPHSLTHSLAHSLSYSLTLLLTHSLTLLVTNSLSFSLSCSLTHSLAHSLTHSWNLSETTRMSSKHFFNWPFYFPRNNDYSRWVNVIFYSLAIFPM